MDFPMVVVSFLSLQVVKIRENELFGSSCMAPDKNVPLQALASPAMSAAGTSLICDG